MVKCCVVHGCKSGHSEDRRKRKAKGLRKSTLFQVPKCHIRRQLWVNALQQELKGSDRVCELHFSNEYIMKGKSVLINGKNIFIENDRWHLTNNAIPIGKDDYQNQQLMICNQSTEVEELCLLSEQQICDRVEQILLVEPEDFQPAEVTLEQSIEPSTFQMGCDKIVSNEELLEQTTSSSPVSLPIPNEVSLEQLISSFSAVLPERWCYFLNSPDMILIYLDASTLLEKFRLRITYDLCIKFTVSHRSEIILTDRVTSMEELYAFMREAETYTICCGTSFNENRYAVQCSGIITQNDNYQRQQLNPRCKACRTLRQRMQANIRYNMRHECPSTLAMHIQRKKELYGKRCNRLNKKVSFNDILRVDRKKINLDSSYGPYMTNARVYDLVSSDVENTINGELVEQDVVSKTESTINEIQSHQNVNKTTDNNRLKLLNTTVKTYSKTNTISKDSSKNSNFQEIERELEEREIELGKKKDERQKEIEESIKDIQDEDFDNRDIKPDMDIDMEDIFKGLEEEQLSEVESLPEPSYTPTPPKRAVTIVPKKTKIIKFPKNAISLSKAMCSSRILFLSIEEQKAAHDAKLRIPAFVRATYKCALCLSTSFHSLCELNMHVEKYKSESKFEHVCTICKRRFENEHELTIHSAMMHWYQYECNTCGKQSYDYSSLLKCYEKHKKKQGKMVLNKRFTRLPLSQNAMYRTLDDYTGLVDTAVKCSECNIGFEKLNQLTTHLGLHLNPPNAEQIFECDICHLKFIELGKMTKHMEKWHLYSYTCNTCNYVFMNWKQVIYHIKHNMCRIDKDNNLMTCKFCGRRVTMTSVYQHMKLQHFNQYCNIHCNICGDSFDCSYKLYRHQLTWHGYVRLNHHELGDPRYLCVHCDVFFTDENAYHTHVVRFAHEEAKNVPNGCTACKRLFETVEEQQTHNCKRPYSSYKYHASYPKPCCYCDVELGSRLEYSTHIHTVHRELTYLPLSGYDLCELCGKTVYKKGFSAHMKMYHDDNVALVPCRYCPELLNNHTAAVNHILNNHTHKPYLCAACPMRFKHRCEARDHILKVHTPVMLYYCSTCDRRFAHLDFLNDHSIKVHGTSIKNRSVYLPRRKARRVVVYPLMKIDGTLIDKEYLDKAEIQICDYMDENDRKVDNYLNHVVFNSIDETIVIQGKKKKPYKCRAKANKDKTNVDTDMKSVIVAKLPLTPGNGGNVISVFNKDCDYKIKVQAGGIELSTNDNLKENIEGSEAVNDVAIEDKGIIEFVNEGMPEGLIEDANEIPFDIISEEIIEGTNEGSEGSKDEDVECKSHNSMKIEMLDEEYESHEVLEVNGNEYVTIGGILYKVERE